MTENVSKEITQLTIATAFIPEMREDIKEIMRAIKGNNGNLGISARLAQNEAVVADIERRMDHFSHSCEMHRKETNAIINDRFDMLLAQLNSVSNKKIDQLVENGRINEEEAREIRKDDRKFSFEFKKDFRLFLYGIAAGVAFRVIELIVSLFI